MIQTVPLISVPNQVLNVPLNIDGKVINFTITLKYNEIAGYWVLTLQDNNGVIVLNSVPLVTGGGVSANLLGQFAYLKAGSMGIINASATQLMEYPNQVNLGSDFILIWGDTPAA